MGLVENVGAGTLYMGITTAYPSSPICPTSPFGTMDFPAGAVFSDNVDVTAFGTLTSEDEVTNNGKLTLEPGATTGLASYQQTSDGWLKEQAAGDGGTSPLTVTGGAELSGVIELDPIDGYVIAPRDSFVVLTASGVSGHFDSLPDGMTASYGPPVVLTQT